MPYRIEDEHQVRSIHNDCVPTSTTRLLRLLLTGLQSSEARAESTCRQDAWNEVEQARARFAQLACAVKSRRGRGNAVA